MPSCVLRVSGSTAKVREFLSCSTLKPTKVYWRGDEGFPKSRGPSKVSGFNITLSGSYGDSIEKQARQALLFMRKYREDMLLLQTLRFKSPVVDFGLYDLATEDCPWPTYRLPALFIKEVGAFGFDIELSFYGPP